MKIQPQTNSSIFSLLDQFLTRKTVFGFAAEVKSYDNLPVSFREVLCEVLTVNEPVLRIILIPFQGIVRGRQNQRLKWGILPWEILPEMVLVLCTGRLLVLSPAQLGARPDVISISISDLLFLETGNVLLHSWFGWAWVNRNHVHQEQVYYNSVGRHLFDGLAAQLRQGVFEAKWGFFPDLDPCYEHLEGLPFKFRNLIRLHMLLPGEQIQAVVYRTQVKQMRWRRDSPGFLPNLATIRTNAHIIITHEDPVLKEGGHGLITQYLPVHWIHHVTINYKDREHLELVFHLKLDGEEYLIKTLFSAQQIQAIQDLVAQWLPLAD